MSEPYILINLFTMPADAVDTFVQGWPASTAPLADAPGFRGTRLHRAVSPEAPHQIVNIARWDSIEQWKAALAGFQPRGERRLQAQAAGILAQPAFYRVAAVAPDPLAGAPGGSR